MMPEISLKALLFRHRHCRSTRNLASPSFVCCWPGTALFTTFRQSQVISRLRLTALLFSWASAASIVYLSRYYIYNTMAWTDQAWLSGLLSMVSLFVFVAFYHPYRQLENITFPRLSISGVMKTSVKLIRQKSMWWIFYPIFIAVAVFLYYSFSKSVLTLWWVVECFAIFSLAFWARENYFRFIAFRSADMFVQISPLRLDNRNLDPCVGFSGHGSNLVGYVCGRKSF